VSPWWALAAVVIVAGGVTGFVLLRLAAASAAELVDDVARWREVGPPARALGEELGRLRASVERLTRR
jgi:hypothetical protein